MDCKHILGKILKRQPFHIKICSVQMLAAAWKKLPFPELRLEF